MDYTQKYGLESESDYPYKGVDGTCKYDKTKATTGVVTSHIDVTPKSVDQLTAALQKGPVSVAIEADKLVFQFYKTGVLTSSRCGQNLDHGVLAVGTGTENGTDYFLVKNSWGTTWGDKGYVKIGATSDDVCGILLDPSQPFDQ